MCDTVAEMIHRFPSYQINTGSNSAFAFIINVTTFYMYNKTRTTPSTNTPAFAQNRWKKPYVTLDNLILWTSFSESFIKNSTPEAGNTLKLFVWCSLLVGGRLTGLPEGIRFPLTSHVTSQGHWNVFSWALFEKEYMNIKVIQKGKTFSYCHWTEMRLLMSTINSNVAFVWVLVCMPLNHKKYQRTNIGISDVWLTAHRNSVWIRKTN